MDANMFKARLKNYDLLLAVKPPSLKSQYPFAKMDEKEVNQTLKQIELVYQNIVVEVPDRNKNRNNKNDKYDKNNKNDKHRKPFKKGGGGNITVVCV
jgi:hypothetical protein